MEVAAAAWVAAKMNGGWASPPFLFGETALKSSAGGKNGILPRHLNSSI